MGSRFCFHHSAQNKFIPLLRVGHWDDTAVPIWIQTKIGVDFRGDPYSEEQYQLLLRTLHQAQEKAPPIGPRPTFEAPASHLPSGILGNAVTPVLKPSGTEPAQYSEKTGTSNQPKPSPEAYALYEKKGTDQKIQVFVRPIDSSTDLYSFESSDGKYEEGRYLRCDLDLKEAGYTRMQSFNGTSGQHFNLPA
jgi:hypothetical protein